MESKIAVLIDGENFRKCLCKLFPHKFYYLPTAADWTSLFRSVSIEGKFIRAYWYVIDEVDIGPYSVDGLFAKKELGAIKKQMLKSRSHLHVFAKKLNINVPQGSDIFQHQGLIKVKLPADPKFYKEIIEARKKEMENRARSWVHQQDGIQARCDFIEFRRSGSIRYDAVSDRLLNEKGVDVNLGSDIVDFRTKFDHLILFSGDADYIPAIQKYKDSARHVTAVTFKTQDGELLPGGARRLKLKVDKTVEMSYTTLAGFLHLTSAPEDIVEEPVEFAEDSSV